MLTSSKFPNGDPRWPVVMHMTGIFDSDPLRNPWAGANQVFVGYCSSDAWAGNIGAADTPLSTLKTISGTLGWNFRGQVIIAAVMDALVTEWGLGAVPGHRLLFGGCSAGSRGGALARAPKTTRTSLALTTARQQCSTWTALRT